MEGYYIDDENLFIKLQGDWSQNLELMQDMTHSKFKKQSIVDVNNFTWSKYALISF